MPAWQDNFKAASLKAGFGLYLTRAMCEFLSAVADDVCWDRGKYGSAPPYPNSFLATAGSLYKRGLIVKKDDRPTRGLACDYDFEWSNWQLTPAGVRVVELLKIAGLFVEADAAINKRTRAKVESKKR